MASIPPDVQVLGKIANIAAFEPLPTASVPEQGTVEIALCGYGPMTPRVAGEALFGRVTSIDAPVNAQGGWSVFLYSNRLIEPAGTYYTITTRDENGDIVQVEAYYLQAGSWDLSNLQPYDPGQAPPPLPPLIVSQLLVVPYAPNPVFDGSQHTAFLITLAGDVTQAAILNMSPGNLYTFIRLQDGTGGHAFVWPSNVYGATPISIDPNTYTTQTFVALDDGSLLAIGAGTYYTL
jgi:hypothetical protein